MHTGPGATLRAAMKANWSVSCGTLVGLGTIGSRHTLDSRANTKSKVAWIKRWNVRELDDVCVQCV